MNTADKITPGGLTCRQNQSINRVTSCISFDGNRYATEAF